ncbi:RNA-directed DNA polymerase, partial [Planococcus sp. SIMBA_143]
YRVRTDIANFYKSIYSHSLPWALIGIAEAKGNRGSSHWYNKIDKATRISQRNETKGITIGPATSSILSEIILFPVDAHLRCKGYR